MAWTQSNFVEAASASPSRVSARVHGALGGEADEDEAEEAAMRRFDAAPADAAAAGGAAGGLDAIPEGEANQAVDLRQYV